MRCLFRRLKTWTLGCLVALSLAASSGCGDVRAQGIIGAENPTGDLTTVPATASPTVDIALNDDVEVQWGDSTDFECHYDSVATRWECNNLTGLVLYVDDGGTAITFVESSQELTLGHDGTYHTITGNDPDGILLGTTGGVSNHTMLLDLDVSATTIGISSPSATAFSLAGAWIVSQYLQVGATSIIRWNGRTELFSDVNGQLQIEQADNTVGVTLDANDAADTLTIKDMAGTGDGALVVGGVTNSLTFDHDGTYHTITGNDPDGILLGTTGGTWNETLLLDFDRANGFIYYDSTSGASVHSFVGIIDASGGIQTNGTTAIEWSGRTELFSDTDGQLQIEQADNTVGVTLDANDAADTLTIKNLAGTGDGALVVGGVTNSLTLDHDGTYHTIQTNDADGILLSSTTGENLLLDFDFSANQMRYTSTSGVATHNFNGTVEGDNFKNAAAGFIFWDGRTELTSDADGQVHIEQSDNTVGVTLDANDAADTLTIKDQAGTGDGNLVVTGTTETQGQIKRQYVEVADGASPYAVLATDYVILCNVTTAVEVDLPASASSDNRVLVIKNRASSSAACTVDPNASELIDNTSTSTSLAAGESIRIINDGTEWHVL